MRLRVFLLVLGLILAHLVLHVGFGLGMVAPDLSIVALLIGSRSVRASTGAGLGFFLGLLEDAFSMTSFGANVFAMTLVGAVGARFRDFFVGDSITFLATFFVLGKWTRDLLVWSVSDVASRPLFTDHMLIESPITAVYAAAAGIAARLLFMRGTVSR